MATKRKHNDYSLDMKRKIVIDIQKGTKTRNQIIAEFGVSKSTLSTWIKNTDKIIKDSDNNGYEQSRKRARNAQYEDLEIALLKWFTNARSQNMPVSGPILITKAEEFAKKLGHDDFKCSNGWLHRFQMRHDIVFKRICGESKSVDMSDVHKWHDGVLKDILETYDGKDIYNCDETGVFYKMLPDKTMTFKSDTAHGVKAPKDRLTVLVASNMDGSDKLPLLVIGKSLKPRCFKHQKSLPTTYLANKKAWMTSEIFTNWIKKLDEKFEAEGRNVAMLLDNCTAHPKVNGLAAITLYFLPPNTTSATQPMDQGIIQNFKCHYRRHLVDKMSSCINAEQPFSVNVLDALHFLRSAWENVSAETISNCFFKVVTDNASPAEGLDIVPDWTSTLTDSFPMDAATFSDYIAVDNRAECIEVVDDDSIIEQVLTRQDAPDDVEDADEPQAEPPSINTAISLLSDIRLTIGTCPDADKAFDQVNSVISFLERHRAGRATQRSITDFFQKK